MSSELKSVLASVASDKSMAVEHFDVLIIGAGLSGITAAHYLQSRCPERTFAILEARDAIGGTWDLFRYPGIRSDSDLYTFGFSFAPWRDEKAIADGPLILGYVRETAAKFRIDKGIRFNQKVTGATWDTSRGQWTVDVKAGTEEAPDLGAVNEVLPQPFYDLLPTFRSRGYGR